VINCQSLLAKKTTFAVFIDENKPDIVVGSESWLSPSVNNHEVFPHDYIVHRKDRADNYGGVFVACRIDFVRHELPLDTTAEVVPCRIVFDGQQPLYIDPQIEVFLIYKNCAKFLTLQFVITLMILFGWPVTSISLTLNGLPLVLPTQGTQYPYVRSFWIRSICTASLKLWIFLQESTTL